MPVHEGARDGTAFVVPTDRRLLLLAVIAALASLPATGTWGTAKWDLHAPLAKVLRHSLLEWYEEIFEMLAWTGRPVAYVTQYNLC